MACDHYLRDTFVSCQYGQGLASPNVPADERPVVGDSEDEAPQAVAIGRKCDSVYWAL